MAFFSIFHHIGKDINNFEHRRSPVFHPEPRPVVREIPRFPVFHPEPRPVVREIPRFPTHVKPLPTHINEKKTSKSDRMSLFSIFNEIGKHINNAEHTVFHEAKSGLATAYEFTKQGATDFYRADAGAGYELGHFLRTGRVVPFSQAEKATQNMSTKGFLFNIPYELGAKTGGQLVKSAGSLVANTIPFTGTFGHLFAHPRENIFNKASDVAFGILDAIGVGDVLQVAKKPIEKGVDVISNTLAKRFVPGITDIQPPKLPIFKTPLPILHLPHIDIHPSDLNTLVKSLTGDKNAVVKGIQDLGNGIKRVVAEDFFTHILHVNENLGKIEHSIIDQAGNIIKVGQHTENDIAKIIGKGEGGLNRVINTFGHIFHSKPVTYGLLGVGIGAPLLGGVVTGGSTNTASSSISSTGGTQQPTPSSPLPYNPPIGGGGTGGGGLASPSSPLPGGGSSQTSDVLNPYSPQAQYYSALAQNTSQSTTPTTSTSPIPNSTTKSIFSSPYVLIGIAVVVIIIILLLVR